MKKPKVFVAMSGGVDSSVAAALLKKSGDFDIVGCFMKCWSAFDQCSVERDAEDARTVAEKLGIPFYIFDFEREYRERVFDYMVKEYAVGRTPNPDVFCNSEIKFGIFLEKALALGADFVATGHYAKIQNSKLNPDAQSGRDSDPQLRRRVGAGRRKTQNHNSKFKIFQSKDQNKDQSYFLWRLTQKQLKHTIFPIGDYLKSEVRDMAREFGLPVADKKDSQGLCFVGKIPFDNFLREHLPQNPGPVRTISGKVLGEHDGLNFYTIGQRHGVKIGGQPQPLYVAQKEVSTNTLIVADGIANPALFKKEIGILDANWISEVSPEFPLECEARIRYRQPLQNATLHKLSTMDYKLIFAESQRAAAPGQSAVFYKSGEILGGGIIK